MPSYLKMRKENVKGNFYHQTKKLNSAKTIAGKRFHELNTFC